MLEKNYTDSLEIKKKPVLPNKKAKHPLINDMGNNSNECDSDDEDELNVSRAENSKIKYLPPSVIKDIEQKNVARKLAGLPSILTCIRHCLTCGAKFQSAGNRTCGCASRVAGIIAGREII